MGTGLVTLYPQKAPMGHLSIAGVECKATGDGGFEVPAALVEDISKQFEMGREKVSFEAPKAAAPAPAPKVVPPAPKAAPISEDVSDTIAGDLAPRRPGRR
jgi:hypothetical protein